MKQLAVLFMVLLLFTGCKWIQFNPSTEISRYEAFGGTIGVFMKMNHPNTVRKAEPWIKGVLVMSDEEIIKKNVLLTAYEYALKEHPEDAAFITMIKGLVDLLGFQLVADLSNLDPLKQNKYILCTRGLLKGYSDAVK